MAANGWDVELETTGFESLIRVLKTEDPRILRQLRAELRGVGSSLAAAASAKFFGRDVYRVQVGVRGLTVYAANTGGGGRNEWGSEGRLAAILESFGAKQTKTTRAAACLATLNARYGTPGRFLNAAWLEGKWKYRQAAADAAHRAELALNERLMAEGLGE